MKENFDRGRMLSAGTLKAMRTRYNTQSAIKLSIHLGIFVALFALLATVELSFFWLIPTLAAFGFVISSLYAPFHETTHQTAFASKRLNEIGAWVTGLIYGYSPGVHAGFHFAHHRHTNREDDPEKGFSLPDMPGRTGLQILVAGVLGMLIPVHSLILSLVPTRHWDKFEASWAPMQKRGRLIWESRIVATFWIAGFTAMALVNPTMIWYCLIGIFIGRFLHGFITVAEHEGLPEDGHMFNRTRTTLTNSVYRWFWWNMNYHSEHHAWPAIPWHALPDLHHMTAEKDMNIVHSYTDFFLNGKHKEIQEGLRSQEG